MCAYICVCMCMYESAVPRVQEGASDTLELECQAVVSFLMWVSGSQTQVRYESWTHQAPVSFSSTSHIIGLSGKKMPASESLWGIFFISE